MAAIATPTEKLEFKTELKQLLHLITHSLYSNKEIFLRELISNASDAINKIKFDSLARDELLEGNKDWKIKIVVDRDSATLTVSDNGVGMAREDAVADLGTIARSGTRAFLENLKNASNRPELIGQFGVGFYSAFNEFYKQISSDYEPPARVIHYTAEGTNEFRVLLFIPAHRPVDLQWGEVKAGPRLYVQRVLIMDHCEALLPPYLRFVRGVVDSSDLPLNISRELLQQNPLLERMQKNVVKSVLKALEEMKGEEYDKYSAFFRELGAILKEGLSRDWANREKIADLLLCESMKTPAGQCTTLAQYVEAMPGEQKDVYYLIGDSREQIEHSPYLEAPRARGQDVLLLTDPVDEFVIPGLGEYGGKKLKAVDRGELDADGAGESKKAEAGAKLKSLFEHLKSRIAEVSDVRASSRLEESAACLVAGEGGLTAHMERLMQRMGRGEDVDAARRILELNPEHPAVLAMQKLFEKDAQDPRVEAFGRLLHDQAVIAEGSKVKDPLAFARRINELLVQSAG